MLPTKNMAFNFMIPVISLAFPSTNSLTWDLNKYDSLRSGGEKVKNSVNSFSEGMGGKRIAYILQG